GQRLGSAALLGDQPGGARSDLEALERHLVGIRVAAARAGEHAHPHPLVEGTGGVLDHALLQARRLDDAKLEIEVGVVGMPLEGGAQHAREARVRETEALAAEPLAARDLHRHEGSKRPPHAPPRGAVAAPSGDAYDARVAWDASDRLLAEMGTAQDAKVLALARRIVPRLTPEDLRNPHDFLALMESPEFNYEDGVLAGIRAAEMAVRAARRKEEKGARARGGARRPGGPGGAAPPRRAAGGGGW